MTSAFSNKPDHLDESANKEPCGTYRSGQQRPEKQFRPECLVWRKYEWQGHGDNDQGPKYRVRNAGRLLVLADLIGLMRVESDAPEELANCHNLAIAIYHGGDPIGAEVSDVFSVVTPCDDHVECAAWVDRKNIDSPSGLDPIGIGVFERNGYRVLQFWHKQTSCQTGIYNKCPRAGGDQGQHLSKLSILSTSPAGPRQMEAVP